MNFPPPFPGPHPAFPHPPGQQHQYNPAKQSGRREISGDPSKSAATKSKFYTALESKKFSDFTLVYEGNGEVQEFKVHKIVLYVSSGYFKTMFDGSWTEQKRDRLEVTHSIGLSAFNEFLTYLYTSSLAIDSLHLCFDLYTLADYYQVPNLTKRVVTAMKLYLKVETINQYTDFMEGKIMNEDFNDMIVDFVCKMHRNLVDFEFHKLGNLIDRVFAKFRGADSLPPIHYSNSDDEQGSF
eukprot:gene9263-10226_t